MQFQPKTAARLVELYRLLREHFGYAHPWWPGTPFQIATTAVLVQQCDWSVVWDAVLRLEAGGVSNVPALADETPERIQDAIRKVTFAPTKAARLVGIARWISGAGFGSFEEFLSPAREVHIVRREALTLTGVGPETADSWLNYASEQPAFVVDAYTRRVFHRLNLIPGIAPQFWKAGPYAQIQQFFEVHLLTDLDLYAEFDFPADVPRDVALLRDYHAQLVELGKHHCSKSKPRCYTTGRRGWPDYPPCASHCLPEACSGCPLADVCRFPLS